MTAAVVVAGISGFLVVMGGIAVVVHAFIDEDRNKEVTCSCCFDVMLVSLMSKYLSIH